MQGDNYSPDFFAELRERARRSAGEIVPHILDWIKPTSVVDLGCGVGTWLAVFQEHGIEDILGLDGDYIDRAMLDIPAPSFHTADLSQPLVLERQFDLALCLEVAEHLPRTSAATLVHSLVQFSPVVLFFAAIPSQGGVHHVNEQWPAYWARLFSEEDYVFIDCLRREFWNNQGVSWWYAQNMLLFVKADQVNRYPGMQQLRKTSEPAPLPLVHPGKYIETVWGERFWQSMAEFRTVTPSSESFVLIDNGEFYARLDKDSGVIPFLEKDGEYWGPPPNGATASSELERLRRAGAGCVVILWPAFWWLEDYRELNDYLSDFPCLLRNERIIVFSL